MFFRTFDSRNNDSAFSPFAEFEAARIHQELGEFDEARESYEHVLVAWRDADPELRPRIDGAREALARLPKLLRREAP